MSQRDGETVQPDESVSAAEAESATDASSQGPSEKASMLWGYAVSIVVLAAVLWPSLRTPAQDSFPLSNYPMFSLGRPDARISLHHAMGIDGQGHAQPLPPMISAGNREVLQAMMTIRLAVQHDPQAYCAEVADRVAADSDFASVEAVQVAWSTYDGLTYFEAEEPGPVESFEVARCEVPR